MSVDRLQELREFWLVIGDLAEEMGPDLVWLKELMRDLGRREGEFNAGVFRDRVERWVPPQMRYVQVHRDAGDPAAMSFYINGRLVTQEGEPMPYWRYRREDTGAWAVFNGGDVRVLRRPELWGWTMDEALATVTSERAFDGVMLEPVLALRPAVWDPGQADWNARPVETVTIVAEPVDPLRYAQAGGSP